MHSADAGCSWTGPDAVPELDWGREPDGAVVAVADVTPGWHARTRKCLATGIKVRYDTNGAQLEDRPHSRETAYTVYDPDAATWHPWRVVELPECDGTFFLNGSGCSQWLVAPDDCCLVPITFCEHGSSCCSVTVLRCGFDGDRLEYIAHGDELHLDVQRGLCEPSLARYGERCYLTLRNDAGGYVTASDDGLHYGPIQLWTFDDGAELGSYNTQQHWLAHSSGLFLVYTRRGADNDHVMRHRAPLFMAQVDPDRLCVLRETERVLIPEHGAPMGNFGAAAVSATESWVTTAEFMWPAWNDTARERGAAGRVFVARVIWGEPNGLALQQTGR